MYKVKFVLLEYRESYLSTVGILDSCYSKEAIVLFNLKKVFFIWNRLAWHHLSIYITTKNTQLMICKTRQFIILECRESVLAPLAY